MAGMAPLSPSRPPDRDRRGMAFMASTQAGWVNGHVVRVDGGIG